MRTYRVTGYDDKGRATSNSCFVISAESDRKFDEIMDPIIAANPLFSFEVIGDGGEGFVSASWKPIMGLNAI